MLWNPDDYAKNSGAQLGWAQELLARLNLSGDEALLDVGCGDGRITATVAQSLPGGFVLGVDSSPEFIAYARAHYPRTSHPNLCFAQIDARALVWDRPFGIIFSNAVLHWVDDHPAFLAGCARLPKPRGRLIISCGGAGNAEAIVSFLDALIRQPRWRGYFVDFTFPYFFYTPEDYTRWLSTAGFCPPPPGIGGEGYDASRA